MKSNYSASDLSVLKGLQPVQTRPGMYTDTTSPNHLAQEVIDNSVDEAQAGFANFIHVTIHKDGSLSVKDNGRGMPTDIHPEENMTGVELILTKLHAGGKFSNKNYQFAGGLHGVGISVVNALSNKVIVEVAKNGGLHQIEFQDGIKTTDLNIIKKIPKKETGTYVRFWPNEKYFDQISFIVKHMKSLLKAKSMLCNGLRVKLTLEQQNEDFEWYYENGLGSYLEESLEGFDIIPSPPFKVKQEEDEVALEAIFCWSYERLNNIRESYANLIPTIQGGTHINGFRQGILDAIKEFCDFRGLIPKNIKLTPDDTFEGCQFILSVKLSEPQFSSQTKERLTSRTIASWVSGVVKDQLSLFLNANPEIGEKIAEKVILEAQKRLRKSQKVVRKKVVTGPALPGKLTDCVSQDVGETELFLVEGDSAGGSARQARDRNFQAIMPLRGKILNTWEVNSKTVLSSQEIHDIAVAIGVDPDCDDISNLRYGKVCILADADSDGAHIATLICALFAKHFKILIERGHIYIAMPPLYRIDYGNKVEYALDNLERQDILNRLSKDAKTKNKNIKVTRFKGLGEMNPTQLRETTLNPNTRRLIQLNISNEESTYELLDKLLSKKRSPDRKVWLEEKGHLAQEILD